MQIFLIWPSHSILLSWQWREIGSSVKQSISSQLRQQEQLIWIIYLVYLFLHRPWWVSHSQWAGLPKVSI